MESGTSDSKASLLTTPHSAISHLHPLGSGDACVRPFYSQITEEMTEATEAKVLVVTHSQRRVEPSVPGCATVNLGLGLAPQGWGAGAWPSFIVVCSAYKFISSLYVAHCLSLAWDVAGGLAPAALRSKHLQVLRDFLHSFTLVFLCRPHWLGKQLGLMPR